MSNAWVANLCQLAFTMICLVWQEKLEQGIIKEADELEDVLQDNTNILILAYAR